jgi:glycosyltransferase involved in cell wall biosynthesis
MERLSYELTTRLSQREPATVIAMRRRAPALPLFFLTAAARLLLGCAARRVTLLHLGDPVLAPLGLIARAFGVATVVTIHGLDVAYASPAYRLWRRLFLRGFDRYVCISEATRAAAIGTGIPAGRTCVIGVGIDVAQRSSVHVARDMNCLLFVGRLVQRKGLTWFVADVLPSLVARNPALRLVVLGDGPERASIAAAARSAGIADRLDWVGASTEDEKTAWFGRAALCVMPNVAVDNDIEGYGIVALEAAAAGCVVAAADIDGLRDAIDDGRSGTLVPSADANAWVRALDTRLRDPAGIARDGESAREYVRDHRGWTAVIDAYERLFRQTVHDARGRSTR